MFAKFFSLCNKCLRSTGFHITLLVGLNILTYLDWRGLLEARNRLGGKWTLYLSQYRKQTRSMLQIIILPTFKMNRKVKLKMIKSLSRIALSKLKLNI